MERAQRTTTQQGILPSVTDVMNLSFGGFVYWRPFIETRIILGLLRHNAAFLQQVVGNPESVANLTFKRDGSQTRADQAAAPAARFKSRVCALSNFPLASNSTSMNLPNLDELSFLTSDAGDSD